MRIIIVLLIMIIPTTTVLIQARGLGDLPGVQNGDVAALRGTVEDHLRRESVYRGQYSRRVVLRGGDHAKNEDSKRQESIKHRTTPPFLGDMP